MNRSAITLLRSIPAPRIAGLLALMLGAALTEGAGILALVPMLSLMSDGAAALPGWAQPLAVHVTLPALLVFFVMLVALRALLQYAVGVTQAKLQLALIDRWRSRVFTALVRADWRTISSLRRSDQTSLIVSGIDRLGFGFSSLLSIVSSAATLAAIWIAALWLSPLLALCAIGGGVLVLAGFVPLRRRAHRLGVRLGEDYRRVQAVLDDTLRALRLLKSHGREQQASDAMTGSMAQLREAQVTFQRAASRSRAMLHIGAAILLAIIVAIAVANGVPNAVLLPLIVLFARSVPLLDTVQYNAQQWAHAAPVLAETQDLLATVQLGAENAAGDDLPTLPERRITLDGVTVHHAGRAQPAVHGISLSLAVGSITALVGPSGAGKSTIADLLGGLLVPDSGTLAVDGRQISGEALINWRRSVAYVHQEPVLFPATIRENLAWAEPDADEAQMRRALTDAAAGFVFDLPKGLDTPVGDAGHQLSGGERQRIAFARALLRDPALLILDEAASALDPRSEALIASAVAAMKGERTIVIIAHRGVLTDLADDIVNVSGGRIDRIESRAKVRA